MTVGAISQTTVQVLLAVGLDRLTTTRVAERAGVSVGTLYQYYPNRQALLYAVLKVDSSKGSGSSRRRVSRKSLRGREGTRGGGGRGLCQCKARNPRTYRRT